MTRFRLVNSNLLYMLIDNFSQFKHGDLVFAEDRFQLCISIDHSPVLLVLQVVLLNIIPDLFNDLCSWHTLVTNHFC